jgi:hypothetical protein
MRCENIYCGELISSSAHSCLARVNGSIEVQVPGRHQGKIKFVIRPENVLVSPPTHHHRRGENEFAANLVRWRDCGGYIRLELDGPLNVVAHITQATFAMLKADCNESVNVTLPLSSIHVLRQ